MLKSKKWTWISLLSGAAMVLLLGGLVLFNNTGKVSAAENLNTITQASTLPGLLGDGYLNHKGGPGFPGFEGGEIDYQQLLANALGITVDDLQAAYTAARDTAIDQAVEQGLLTQEQADTMKVWGGSGGRRGLGTFGRMPKDIAGTKSIDEEALLADALGITVEDLQSAREKASQAAIDQAIAEGLITQEQADEMQARKNLMSYLERDTLLAKALGMTVEDLEAAYAEGKNLSTLMQEKGLDAATVREKLQTAYNEALAQAVEDGVITQEQADEMQGRGFGMLPGDRMMPFGDRDGFRGHGGFKGGVPRPNTDDTTRPDTELLTPDSGTTQSGNGV